MSRFPGLVLATFVSMGVVIAAGNATAADDHRMGPAQRLLPNGAQLTQRDRARSRVNRARSIRTRGRVYDEILSAHDTQVWQMKKPVRASVRKRSRVRKRR